MAPSYGSLNIVLQDLEKAFVWFFSGGFIGGCARRTRQSKKTNKNRHSEFYGDLKSISSGYASFDYEMSGYEPAQLVKMDILLNGKPVDALSIIIHNDRAYYIGRDLTQRLQKVIHRQLFEVIIQAAVGSKIIARERVAPLRKDVTAKCYGGDISRKRKLLEKQKEGKKRMRQIGNVEVPQEAFLAVLKLDE